MPRSNPMDSLRSRLSRRESTKLQKLEPIKYKKNNHKIAVIEEV
ncbi:MAG: hypothetical protein ACI92E_002633 [Oceanicoccus sp.]